MDLLNIYQSCTSPVRVLNKYTNQVLYVPCRRCVGCRNHQAKTWVARLMSESKSTPYKLFFTLTYDNDCLPLFVPANTLYANADEFYSDFSNLTYNYNTSYVNYCPNVLLHKCLTRVPVDRVVDLSLLSKLPSSVYIPQPLDSHTCMPAFSSKCFAYAEKRDLQSFFKRLRMLLYRDNDNLLNNIPQYERKFRYFVCSEYGPKTFRPHYHGLFFAQSREVSEAIKFYIYKAWQYCSSARLQCEYVRNGAEQYTAKYVTGSTDLPQVLQCSDSRTFYLASKNPCIGFVSYNHEKVWELVTSRTDKVSTERVDKSGKVSIVDVPLTKQVKNRYFPKCRQFGSLTFNEQLRIYSLLYNEYQLFTSLDSWNLGPLKKFVMPLVDDGNGSKVYDSRLPNLIKKDFRYNLSYSQNLHAARVCCLYCHEYNITPIDYLIELRAYYDRCVLDSLANQFDLQNAFYQFTNDKRYYLSFDLDFIHSLPDDIHQLTLLDYTKLNSYGWSYMDVIWLLYDDCGSLNRDVLDSYIYYSSNMFDSLRGQQLQYHSDSLKNKIINDSRLYAVNHQSYRL